MLTTTTVIEYFKSAKKLDVDWKKLYEEVRDFKKAAKTKHIKAILGVGDLETLRNVA